MYLVVLICIFQIINEVEPHVFHVDLSYAFSVTDMFKSLACFSFGWFVLLICRFLYVFWTLILIASLCVVTLLLAWFLTCLLPLPTPTTHLVSLDKQIFKNFK